MGKRDVPDPLKPAHITGQNPATPERMPGHTGYYSENDRSSNTANEEDLGGRPAFLFRSGEWAGVTLDSSGQNLPARGPGWRLEQYFTLGIRDAAPMGIIPEQVVRAIHSDGYFVWRPLPEPRASTTT